MNNKANKSKILDKALRLLPWYATGWLTPKERSYVKEKLLEFPELQEQLLAEHRIIDIIKEDKSLLDESALEPSELRLKKVLKKIDVETTFVQVSKPKVALITRLKQAVDSFLSGGTTKIQYAGIAAVSTLSIALLFAFISPLVKQQNNIFHPATVETPGKERAENVTKLLVGLSTSPDAPELLRTLREVHAKINPVSGKDGMYRISLSEKLNSDQTNILIKKLSMRKDLFWFAGEAY